MIALFSEYPVLKANGPMKAWHTFTLTEASNLQRGKGRGQHNQNSLQILQIFSALPNKGEMVELHSLYRDKEIWL